MSPGLTLCRVLVFAISIDGTCAESLISVQVLGRTKLVPGNASQPLRGVFTLEPEAVLSGATVFLEAQHPGLTLSFNQPPKVYVVSDLSDPAVTPLVPDVLLDKYR